ncbi:MAG: hypothetical protein MJA28_03845 [Gammaproteobacteria bacterium]|nr:hypothetical protein [Gammaproteobacteria bacterium]
MLWRTPCYLAVWSGMAAQIYYIGFHWWSFPLFILCLSAVKWAFGLSRNDIEGTVHAVKWIAIYYLIGVGIYVFVGDDYLARAIGSTGSLKYFFIVVAFVVMITLFTNSSSGPVRRHTRNRQQTNDSVVYPQDDYSGVFEDPLQEEFRKEYESDVTMGFKKPGGPH